jgi:hypothetical protein
MRRPSFTRRRKRKRVVRKAEQTAVRFLAAFWVARKLVRHRLAAR